MHGKKYSISYAALGNQQLLFLRVYWDCFLLKSRSPPTEILVFLVNFLQLLWNHIFILISLKKSINVWLPIIPTLVVVPDFQL